MLYVHGPQTAKWFTSTGVSVYQNVCWNAKKGTTTSSNAKASAPALVKEDLWDLKDKWKTITQQSIADNDSRPDVAKLD
jgi:hypothetical protein